MKDAMTEEEKKKLIFLIVDDDGQVRDILDGYLKSFGFVNVLQAKDGKAALKIIQNNNQHIDIVISDWEMPHIDGLTLLRAIRKDPNRQGVQFIMVTSQGSRERMKITKAAKSHVDAYVVKPFRAHILLEKINNLINGVEDISIEEFEGMGLAEVPSNGTKIGKVLLDKEAKGLGELVKLATSGIKGPIGSVKMKDLKIKLIIKLSKSYFKIKWFDKAIKLCLEANEIFPKNADILSILARGYFLKEDYGSALQYVKEATKLEPYHVEAQTLIAEIAEKQVS